MVMANLCVSYELNWGDKKEYTDLLAALERFEDRCHALESVWFLCTPWTASQVHAYLRRYLDPQDALLVEEMPVLQGWSGWVRQDVRDWLLEHLGPPS
jgi:hypothetical protein